MNAKRGVLLVVMLVAAFLIATTAMAGTLTATIDFEAGFIAGDIVSYVSSGYGMSGDSIAGLVEIEGYEYEGQSSNHAMIFDATCDDAESEEEAAMQCTGYDGPHDSTPDDDLWQPELGNVLIVSEDSPPDPQDPNDSDHPGSYLSFDFSGFGPDGVVTVDALTALDIEENEGENARIELYDVSSTMTVVDIPHIGDGNKATIAVGVSGVERMVVILDGSGAIDNIEISIEEENDDGGEGCTPGYWKNHLDSWEGYSPGQTVEDVFDVPDAYGLDDDTLLEALNYGGGPGEVGGAKILLRAAVAALLNADSSNVNYPHTTSEIIADVNGALASENRGTMLDLASMLDTDNNLGCPLN